MKKLIRIFLILFVLSTNSYAQDYKIKLSQGTLSFRDISNLTIEGYKGNEVLVNMLNKIEIPESKKGLFAVNSDGLKDNTGIGLAVTELAKDNYIITEILEGGEYLIKIPENVNVEIQGKGTRDNEIRLKNLKSNLEISSRTGNINLINITGPLVINSVSGKINVVFNENVKFPISIISLQGEIDVTLPSEIYADLLISTGYGNLYTDMPIAYEKTEQGNEITLNPTTSTGKGGSGKDDVKKDTRLKPSANGSKTLQSLSKKAETQAKNVQKSATSSPFVNLSMIKGKLNGGGGSIVLESRNNNVYVRMLKKDSEVKTN